MNTVQTHLRLFSRCNGEEALFTYPASFSESSRGFVLSYTDRENSIKNTLQYHAPTGRLTLRRTDGGILRFEEGKRLAGIYTVSVFSAPAQTLTSSLSFKAEGAKRELTLAYCISISGEPIDCFLRFIWQAENEKREEF